MSTPTPPDIPWICAQTGAREHYALARVLAARGKLERLLTDYWWPASWSPPLRFAGRRHPQLGRSRVVHLNCQALGHDFIRRRPASGKWAAIQARNDWFQRAHLAKLQAERARLRALSPGVFFAYSYAARDLLAFFRDLGWRTVLGQIDAGPGDARIIAAEIAAQPGYHDPWQPPPQAYWDNLRQEQALADRILVNSRWSRRLCLEAGLPESRIRLLPLALDGDPASTGAASLPRRDYPDRFDTRRPLRVLFLGRICLRKGVHYLLDSLVELRDEPVELRLVGHRDIQIPETLRKHPRIHWSNAVARGQVDGYYDHADVFILPTPSDGFALTQLEAQARGLPVIATTHCGDVVQDGVNGLIIEPLSSASISACLRRCLYEPGLLARLSRGSRIDPEFSLDSLGARLDALEAELLPAPGAAHDSSG